MSSFLIVDADRNFREALAISLRLDGHTVRGAETPEQAMEWLRSAEIDCCVVDAHVWNADAVLDAAAIAGVRTVVTGPHEDLLAHAARRHPAAEALPKPFAAEQLV